MSSAKTPSKTPRKTVSKISAKKLVKQKFLNFQKVGLTQYFNYLKVQEKSSSKAISKKAYHAYILKQLNQTENKLKKIEGKLKKIVG